MRALGKPALATVSPCEASASEEFWGQWRDLLGMQVNLVPLRMAGVEEAWQDCRGKMVEMHGSCRRPWQRLAASLPLASLHGLRPMMRHLQDPAAFRLC